MIGLGTKEDTSKSGMQFALDNGYTFIDTKESNKSLLHFKRLSFNRSNLIISSKLVGESHPQHHNPKNVRAACVSLLQKTGLSYWDIYYIHTTYSFGKYPLLHTYDELLKLKSEGIILNVGLSNVTFEQLETLMMYTKKPDYIQIEIHPYLVENRLVKMCQAHQIKIVAHSPLGSTLWPDIAKEPLLLALSTKYGVTVAQLILNWHVARGIIPIPSSNNPVNIRNNLERIELLEEDVAAISGLNKNKRMWIKPNHYESLGPLCEPLPPRQILDTNTADPIINDITLKGFHVTNTAIDKELHSLCLNLIGKQNDRTLLNKIKTNTFIQSTSNKYIQRSLQKCEERKKLPNINFLPSGTELWHRDTQLQKCLKIIIYLSDVGAQNGPLKLIYPEPSVMNLRWMYDGQNARTTPEEISQNAPSENIISVEGPPHTMILFEGTSLHCGGYVQKGSRRVIYLE